MTDLSKHTLAELEAEIERRKAEPDYAAWEPKWQAFREAMELPDGEGHRCSKLSYIHALIAAHNTLLAGEADPDEGWIPWTGGECPVPGVTVVAVKFRGMDGSRESREGAIARHWYWLHKGSSADIIAYRVVKEP